jgi:hypothetical protein
MRVTKMRTLKVEISFKPKNHVGTPSHIRMKKHIIPQDPTRA